MSVFRVDSFIFVFTAVAYEWKYNLNKTDKKCIDPANKKF